MQKDILKRYKSAANMLCDLEEFKKSPSITFDYDYFVDNSPTRFIPDADTTNKENNENDKSPIIPILAGISATFVIAIVVLLVILIPKFLKSTGEEFPCPNMTGVSYDVIESNEEYQEKFELVFEWESNSEYQYGVIFRQYPEPNDAIKEGGKITLYISEGVKTVKIPDVYNHSIVRARTELEALGFVVKEEYESHEDISSGNVIRTFPSRGTSVTEKSEITLYISTGSPTFYVRLPNLIGLSKEEAEKELQRKGLVLGNCTEVDSTEKKGVVVEQTPEVGSIDKVGTGTSVDIKISSGKMTYILDLTVSIPSDYAYDNFYIALWNSSEEIAISKKILLSSLLTEDGYKYTFNDLKIEKFEEMYTLKLTADLKTYHEVMYIHNLDKEGNFNDQPLNNYPKKSSTEPINTSSNS